MNPLLYRSAASLVMLACAGQALCAPRTIRLEVGQQKTWTQAKDITRAATGDNNVVGVNVVPPRGVVITAKKPGSAMISVWEAGSGGEPSAQFQVQISPSIAISKQALGQQAPGAHIDNEGSKLRLSGDLSSLESHAAITAEIKADNDKTGDSISDVSKSNFDVQVRIDVKIVEVSRQKLKEAGFYAQRTGPTGQIRALGSPGSVSALLSDKDTGKRTIETGNGFIPFGDAFSIFQWGQNSLTVFSALEANGFAYTLAEPSLTALSGQTATFLAGGEIPIPLRTGSDGGISVDYKQFGIRLGLTPTVLDKNRITLKVAPEVSEIDEGLSVTLGGFAIPGLRVRRTETTVAMGDGETFVISGLISRQNSSSVDKFPILGDIPILGAFFRSNRFTREDKELPGEEVRNYDPGYMRFLLLESGRFNQPDSGFSQ